MGDVLFYFFRWKWLRSLCRSACKGLLTNPKRCFHPLHGTHSHTEITDLSWFLCANMLIVSLKEKLNIRFSTIMSNDAFGSHYFQAWFFSIWRNKENLCKASVRPQSGTDLASEAQLPDVESLNDLDGGKRVTWLSSTYSLTFECHFYHIFFVSRVISYIIDMLYHQLFSFFLFFEIMMTIMWRTCTQRWEGLPKTLLQLILTIKVLLNNFKLSSRRTILLVHMFLFCSALSSAQRRSKCRQLLYGL